eukprot:TRINITY_DN20172_c0_g1_i1.p1 TRINITY_DN20172_c0_g1~~TRINITY_DN20172_c0_g1_i1.p1  ORF type:complete len:1524 (+),score=285.00 TRINITY_DN20172_c0_g1_i1:48-4574(+)
MAVAAPTIFDGCGAKAGTATLSIAGLIESAVEELERHIEEEVEGLSCGFAPPPIAWDGEFFEVTSTVRSRIPRSVEESWGRARQRACCGLLPSLRHAWVSSDAVLHLWDYGLENPVVLTVPADAAIVAVEACQPRPGVFDDGIRCLLVVATHLTVSLVGLYDAADARSVGLQGGDRLQPIALEGYSASTEGAFFHCIRHASSATEDGGDQIFLVCGTSYLYELVYTATPGWLRPRCRLVRHAADAGSGGWWWPRATWRSTADVPVGRLCLLEVTSGGHAVTLDHLGTLRLYSLGGYINDGERSGCEARASATPAVVCALTEAELAAQVVSATGAPLASTQLTRLFLAAADGCGSRDLVRVHAMTAAGERLCLACCARSPVSATKSEASCPSPAIRVVHISSPTRPLSCLRGAGMGCDPTASAARVACVQEDYDSCLYASGVWVSSLRSPNTQKTTIEVSVRLDGQQDEESAGICGGTPSRRRLAPSMVSSDMIDACVLAIAEEHCREESPYLVGGARDGLDSEWWWGSRTFVLLLPHAVQTLTIKRQQRHATSWDCCLHLLRLGAAPTTVPVLVDADTIRGCGGSRCSGSVGAYSSVSWSLVGARLPSFQEMQSHRLLGRAGVPSPKLGCWLQGLLRFLAVMLQNFWRLPLVSRRGRGRGDGKEALYLSISKDVVGRTLAQLKPALQFVRRGLSEDVAPVVGPWPRVRKRSQLYSRELTKKTGVQYWAEGVLNIGERVQEIFGLLDIIHAYACANRVLESPSLISEQERGLAALTSLSFGELVTTRSQLAPVVQLCTALLVEQGWTSPISQADIPEAGKMASNGADEVLMDAADNDGLASGGFDTSGGADDGKIVVSRDGREELREACPSILAMLVQVDAAALPQEEDQLKQWAQRLRFVAGHDPASAADTCCARLQRLQSNSVAAPGRVRLLLDAFVAGLNDGNKASTDSLVTMLARTRKLRFEGAAGTLDQPPPPKQTVATVDFVSGAPPHIVDESRLPFSHQVVFEALLSTSKKGLLATLLVAGVNGLEAFLRERCASCRAAGDSLWRFYVDLGQPGVAAGVLMLMAEGQDLSYGLAERVEYLQRARNLAAACGTLAGIVERLDILLRIAKHVQQVLFVELELLGKDNRISEPWPSIVKERLQELQLLRDHHKLYKVASEFGFFNVILLLIDAAGAAASKEAIAHAWAGLLFASSSSPYAPAQLSNSAPHPSASASLLPFLLVRHDAPFFAGQSRRDSPLDSQECGCVLQRRVEGFITELEQLARSDSQIWDLRLIVALLEYANCAWLLARETEGEEKDESMAAQTETRGAATTAAARSAESHKAWVALSVLPRAPFRIAAPSDIAACYAQMLANFDTWTDSLRTVLPAELPVSMDRFRFHIGEVSICVINRWLEVEECTTVGPQTATSNAGGDGGGFKKTCAGIEAQMPVENFDVSWLETGEGLITLLQRLCDGQPQLLRELVHFEARGRILCRQAGLHRSQRRQQARQFDAVRTRSPSHTMVR